MKYFQPFIVYIPVIGAMLPCYQARQTIRYEVFYIMPGNLFRNFDGFEIGLKISFDVNPAKAGVPCLQIVLDACRCLHDGIWDFLRVCQFYALKY